MTDIAKKERSDKGTKRVNHSKPPRIISIQLTYDDKTEKGILEALDKDVAMDKKANPKANKKTVLVRWLAEYLGLD